MMYLTRTLRIYLSHALIINRSHILMIYDGMTFPTSYLVHSNINLNLGHLILAHLISIFKVMMIDFSIHNVELTAALMETCGRYLYLLPYTHQRMVEILETTARLRRAKNIDLRLQTVLEAAYFAVKPPERVARVCKVLTDVQKYIRFLLWEKLNTATVDEVGDQVYPQAALPTTISLITP